MHNIVTMLITKKYLVNISDRINNTNYNQNWIWIDRENVIFLSNYQINYNFFCRYWLRVEENRGNVNKESLLQNRGIDVLAYRGAVCNWEIIAKSEVLAIFQNNYQAIIFERHE